MNTKQKAQGQALGTDVITKLEGMEVEFDEKVMLFPVEVEEIRDMAPRGVSRTQRSVRRGVT